MTIRLAQEGDAAQIAEIYRPFCENSTVSFETVAPDAREFAARIEKNTKKFPWLVAEKNGVILGYAYASTHRERAAYRWIVEVTIYIHEKHRGKGLGRNLYNELFSRLRVQGIYKAFAGITVPNQASQAFHESMGFTLIGVFEKIGYKMGEWRDVSWWQLTLQPQVKNPPEPTHLSSSKPT